MDAVIDVLVLNYNGCALLAECLPSVARAVAASRHDCRLTIVDNSSTDDSLAWLRREFPDVAVWSYPNAGLVSFNAAVARCEGRVVVLLNNDIRLAEDALDPLVEPLLRTPAQTSDDDFAGDPIFAAAPRCYLFDGTTHEGFQTAVVMRRGLVSASADFAGATAIADRRGSTASAGAVLAVDRRFFLELRGFDPLYLPGRIEDLDLCFRGFMAGYRVEYVPQSVAYHKGAATFGAAFGAAGCDRLALRNTLLFQWKNLRAFRYCAALALWTPLRLAFDHLRAPFQRPERRFPFVRAWNDARRIWNERTPERTSLETWKQSPNLQEREIEFFRRYSPSSLAAGPNRLAQWRREESRRAANYPIAKWYLRPAAVALAERLNRTAVRPWHLTIIGLLCATCAAGLISTRGPNLGASLLILAAWFCDRLDGPLARMRRNATTFGAWLDANVDEAVDLGLHVCVAAAASAASSSQTPWLLLIGFLVGKYLLMYGLTTPQADAIDDSQASSAATRRRSWLRSLYHFPANADVRIHMLAAAVATGRLVEELAFIAVYYNVRWIARYLHVMRHMLRTEVPTTARTSRAAA